MFAAIKGRISSDMRSREMARVCDNSAAETQALIHTAFERYLPNKVVVHAADRLADTNMPLLKGKGRIDGRATAYVCEHYNCQLPVKDPKEFAKQLESKKASAEQPHSP